MKLPIYSRESATKEKFIKFWASQVTDKDIEQDQRLYFPYIGKPLTRKNVQALFKWKNQMPLSNGKCRSVEKNFISRLEEIRQLPSTIEPISFLDMFEGGAIWRIFLLHCWQPAKYPIYDQHVHRAMTFIWRKRREEIAGWSDQKKIKAYVDEYIPIFSSFGSHDSAVDRALWVFGRFIKIFPKFCLEPSEL